MRFAKALPLAILAGLALAACARQPETRVPAPAPSSDAPAPGPDDTQWVKPGVTSERYRADVDSCYNYAQAQVAHDERIESDTGAAFEAFPSGLGLTELRGRMDEFERKNRRASLFTDCMVAKGYRQR